MQEVDSMPTKGSLGQGDRRVLSLVFFYLFCFVSPVYVLSNSFGAWGEGPT